MVSIRANLIGILGRVTDWLVQLPDWTHFRSADADPAGPCCLLPGYFDTKALPRNYIWTIGYIGTWVSPEDAEISAQVRSYSREFLMERQKLLEDKRRIEDAQKQALQRAQQERREEMDRLQKDQFMDKAAIERRIEAGPLAMAKSLAKSVGDLATGGVTDPSARMDICSTCPFKGDDNRCGKCGCFLPAKTRVKKSSCPIGRW